MLLLTIGWLKVRLQLHTLQRSLAQSLLFKLHFFCEISIDRLNLQSFLTLCSCELPQYTSRVFYNHMLSSHSVSPVLTGSPVTLMQQYWSVWDGQSTLAGMAIAKMPIMQVFKNLLLYFGVSKGGQTVCIRFWGLRMQSRSLEAVSNFCL